MKKYFILAGLVYLLTGLTTQSVAQTTNYKAYAIFTYSFTKYVQWPNVAAQPDFIIAVVGKSKVSDELTALVKDKLVEGKKILVKQVGTADELSAAQIIYLSDARSSDLAKVLQRVSGKSTLVITEREGLVKKGAGISFLVSENSTLRFEMNTSAMQASKLKAAEALISMAYKE